MTNVTLLEKARRGRATAIASLNSGQKRSGEVVSIFDSAFERSHNHAVVPVRTHVIEFRSTRSAVAAERGLAA